MIESVNQRIKWINEPINQWIKEWVNQWSIELMNQWISESMNQWVNEWMKEWMNWRMGGWMDGWTDGWTDGWMDGWMAEWATFLCELLLHWATSSLRQLFSQLLLLSTSALTCLAASSSAAPATQLFSSRSCYSAIPHSTRVALWSRTTSQYNAFSNLQLQSRLLGVSHHHWCFPARSRANASSQPGANPHSRCVGANRPPSTV